VHARAGAEITAVTLACGGGRSRTTASRDIGSGGGTSRKKGEARALAGVRAQAGSSTVERSQVQVVERSQVQRCGQAERSAEQRAA
jgi:hypothetical protein